jgi:hypothetical protein
MSVIEHCWLLRDSRPLRATTDEAEAARLPALGVAIAGPFVPFEQLRGAVEALHEYGAHKATCARLGASDTRKCDCGLADALTHFGGQ